MASLHVCINPNFEERTTSLTAIYRFSSPLRLSSPVIPVLAKNIRVRKLMVNGTPVTPDAVISLNVDDLHSAAPANALFTGLADVQAEVFCSRAVRYRQGDFFVDLSARALQFNLYDQCLLHGTDVNDLFDQAPSFYLSSVAIVGDIIESDVLSFKELPSTEYLTTGKHTLAFALSERLNCDASYWLPVPIFCMTVKLNISLQFCKIPTGYGIFAPGNRYIIRDSVCFIDICATVHSLFFVIAEDLCSERHGSVTLFYHSKARSIDRAVISSVIGQIYTEMDTIIPFTDIVFSRYHVSSSDAAPDPPAEQSVEHSQNPATGKKVPGPSAELLSTRDPCVLSVYLSLDDIVAAHAGGITMPSCDPCRAKKSFTRMVVRVLAAYVFGVLVTAADYQSNRIVLLLRHLLVSLVEEAFLGPNETLLADFDTATLACMNQSASTPMLWSPDIGLLEPTSYDLDAPLDGAWSPQVSSTAPQTVKHLVEYLDNYGVSQLLIHMFLQDMRDTATSLRDKRNITKVYPLTSHLSLTGRLLSKKFLPLGAFSRDILLNTDFVTNCVISKSKEYTSASQHSAQPKTKQRSQSAKNGGLSVGSRCGLKTARGGRRSSSPQNLSARQQTDSMTFGESQLGLDESIGRQTVTSLSILSHDSIYSSGDEPFVKASTRTAQQSQGSMDSHARMALSMTLHETLLPVGLYGRNINVLSDNASSSAYELTNVRCRLIAIVLRNNLTRGATSVLLEHYARRGLTQTEHFFCLLHKLTGSQQAFQASSSFCAEQAETDEAGDVGASYALNQFRVTDTDIHPKSNQSSAKWNEFTFLIFQLGVIANYASVMYTEGVADIDNAIQVAFRPSNPYCALKNNVLTAFTVRNEPRAEPNTLCMDTKFLRCEAIEGVLLAHFYPYSTLVADNVTLTGSSALQGLQANTTLQTDHQLEIRQYKVLIASNNYYKNAATFGMTVQEGPQAHIVVDINLQTPYVYFQKRPSSVEYDAQHAINILNSEVSITQQLRSIVPLVAGDIQEVICHEFGLLYSNFIMGRTAIHKVVVVAIRNLLLRRLAHNSSGAETALAEILTTVSDDHPEVLLTIVPFLPDSIAMRYMAKYDAAVSNLFGGSSEVMLDFIFAAGCSSRDESAALRSIIDRDRYEPSYRHCYSAAAIQALAWLLIREIVPQSDLELNLRFLFRILESELAYGPLRKIVLTMLTCSVMVSVDIQLYTLIREHIRRYYSAALDRDPPIVDVTKCTCEACSYTAREDEDDAEIASVKLMFLHFLFDFHISTKDSDLALHSLQCLALFGAECNVVLTYTLYITEPISQKFLQALHCGSTFATTGSFGYVSFQHTDICIVMHAFRNVIMHIPESDLVTSVSGCPLCFVGGSCRCCRYSWPRIVNKMTLSQRCFASDHYAKIMQLAKSARSQYSTEAADKRFRKEVASMIASSSVDLSTRAIFKSPADYGAYYSSSSDDNIYSCLSEGDILDAHRYAPEINLATQLIQDKVNNWPHVCVKHMLFDALVCASSRGIVDRILNYLLRPRDLRRSSIQAFQFTALEALSNLCGLNLLRSPPEVHRSTEKKEREDTATMVLNALSAHNVRMALYFRQCEEEIYQANECSIFRNRVTHDEHNVGYVLSSKYDDVATIGLESAKDDHDVCLRFGGFIIAAPRKLASTRLSAAPISRKHE